jgi:hypothetical protein
MTPIDQTAAMNSKPMNKNKASTHTSQHNHHYCRTPAEQGSCIYKGAAYRVWLPKREPLDCMREVQSLVRERRHVMNVHAALLVGVASGKVEVASHFVDLRTTAQPNAKTWGP